MTDTPLEALSDEHLLDKLENDRKFLMYIEDAKFSTNTELLVKLENYMKFLMYIKDAKFSTLRAYDYAKALDPKKKDIGESLRKLRETEAELRIEIDVIEYEINRRMKQ